MKISVTNLKTKENIEVTCNHIVYKATLKVLGSSFTVIPCPLCMKTDKDKGFNDLLAYMEKYGYFF
jgi:hypothetical protein